MVSLLQILPLTSLSLIFTSLLALIAPVGGATLGSPVLASSDFIFYGGRWDFTNYISYWPGSNIKLRFTSALSLLTVTLGSATTPDLQASISLDYGSWEPITLQPGANVINLAGLSPTALVHIVRISTRNGLTLGNMQLESVTCDTETLILPYRGGLVGFEFIGDQFSMGNGTSQGQTTAWPSILAETYKAERNEIVQSGICLTNITCNGNAMGMITQYWNLMDGNSLNNPAWTASDYKNPTPTVVFIMLGNNDYLAGISAASYTSTLDNFLAQLRTVYPTQLIYVLYDLQQYYNNADIEALNARPNDKSLFHIDTYDWINFSNTTEFANGYLTDVGHQIIAAQITAFLENSDALVIPQIWPSRTN